MKHITYFKQQAKKLFKDYKTKSPYIDIDGFSYYSYTSKYFDIDRILLDYGYDEDNFNLMNAQHIIALIAGFHKWTDLLKASEAELELAKQLFDNQDVIYIDDWKSCIIRVERYNNITLDSESKLDIFKHIILNESSSRENPFGDYRIKRKLDCISQPK